MMKSILALLIASAFIGCSICKNAMRGMIEEELAKTTEKTYFTEGQTIAPYTPAIKVGGFLFISGQIALKPGASEVAGNDIETQARQVLDNLMTILDRAGYSATDVIQCTVYLKDINDFEKMNAIYGAYFKQGKFPTRTTVQVASLPRNALIEIAVIAHKTK